MSLNEILYYIFIAFIICDVVFAISIIIAKYCDEKDYDTASVVFGGIALGSMIPGGVCFLIFIIGIVKLLLKV